MQESQIRRIAKRDAEWHALPQEVRDRMIGEDARRLSSNGTGIGDPLAGNWPPHPSENTCSGKREAATNQKISTLDKA